MDRRLLFTLLLGCAVAVIVAVESTKKQRPPDEVRVSQTATPGATDAPAKAPAAADLKIFRVDGPLEKLQGIPQLTNMRRDDDAAYLVLPTGLEVAGQPYPREKVIAGYVNAAKNAWFVIVQPGDHAFSLMTAEPKPGT